MNFMGRLTADLNDKSPVERKESRNLNGFLGKFNSMESAYFHNFARFNLSPFANLY